MPQEPKKRHSRARQGKRRASISLVRPQTVICKNCGNTQISHSVCAICGYYKGTAVMTKENTQGKTA